MDDPLDPLDPLAQLIFEDDDGDLLDADAVFSTPLRADPSVPIAELPPAQARSLSVETKHAREKALAVKRRQAHRQRVKSQQHGLRAQVAELTAKLRKLHGVTQVSRVNERVARLRTWKQIAARQEEARTIAVAQNRKLRAQVLSQQSTLRTLYSALERGPCSDHDTSILTEVAPSKTVGIELADSSLFDAFLDELDPAYAQTDEMLGSSDLNALSEQTASQKVTRKWDATRGSKLFELVDSRVLPFNFVQTRSVLWQSIVNVHCRNHQTIYGGVADPENTIAVKCHVDCHVRSKNVTAPLVVYLVLRRYTEDERTVLVWRALSEGRGDVSGLYSDETGWTVLRPKTGSSVAGDGATTMETCTRFEPICSNGAGGSSSGASISDTDLFAMLLVNTVDQDNQDITHLMTNLILKDLLEPHLSVNVDHDVPIM